MTLKQFAARKFFDAVEEYRIAIKGDNPAKLIAASVSAYSACRNRADRALLNRIYAGKA